MSESKNKHLFFSLVYSFQMQAMIQLGKLANPVTGKIERDLDAAKVTIDMVDMLKEKTEKNLEDDEIRFINQVASDLKLNFVEENSKQDETSKSGEVKEENSSGEANPDNEKSENKETSDVNKE
ncbi:MAG: hypothetical protein HGGPFJEG_00333 [Ignavibacteria bacterium]|nr:hypothetical protein [Ignavibacteria bacterium]